MVIITKLQVAPVELDVSSQSSQSSSTCQASRAVLFDQLDTAKCMGSTHRMCRVESSQVEFEPMTLEEFLIAKKATDGRTVILVSDHETGAQGPAQVALEDCHYKLFNPVVLTEVILLYLCRCVTLVRKAITTCTTSSQTASRQGRQNDEQPGAACRVRRSWQRYYWEISTLLNINCCEISVLVFSEIAKKAIIRLSTPACGNVCSFLTQVQATRLSQSCEVHFVYCIYV